MSLEGRFGSLLVGNMRANQEEKETDFHCNTFYRNSKRGQKNVFCQPGVTVKN